ncbi:Calx-beta domain-containing protein [Sphingobium yanoikuyae]|uniref:Calx-beta domain-containing protein n=1 Tax=Sphingobium yanoikuyae TaxID=13690 RepID=A0A9X7U8L7_SPHYA|nr:Calx-beta domain-containing protein [Sphingobium yanoikuyae]QNG45756.1 hypothetical protein H3V42_29050 [Sphingobium yanoikuyae]
MKMLALAGVILCAWPIEIACASETITYNYDELGRLVLSTTQGGPNNNVVTSTTLDPTGNRSNYGVSLTGLCQIAALDGGGGSDEFTAYVQVQASSACSGPVTLSYATQDGTAFSGVNYHSASGTVTLQPGETSKTISISPIFGSIPSGQSRILYVNFALQSGAAALSDAQSAVTIVSSL